MNSAWIAVVSILATYNISKTIDDNGDIIELKAEFTDGLVRYGTAFNNLEHSLTVHSKPPQAFQSSNNTSLECSSQDHHICQGRYCFVGW